MYLYVCFLSAFKIIIASDSNNGYYIIMYRFVLQGTISTYYILFNLCFPYSFRTNLQICIVASRYREYSIDSTAFMTEKKTRQLASPGFGQTNNVGSDEIIIIKLTPIF